MTARHVAAALTVGAMAVTTAPALAAPPDRADRPGGRPSIGSPVGVELTEIGRYTAEEAEFDEGGAEIVAYDGLTVEQLEADENLGRLNITSANGYDEDGECIEQVYAYGTRSFSIYTPEGELVYDSGSDFEDVTAELLGVDGYNANNDESGEDAFDSRSDDKGPEPEGVAVGRAYGNTYAFIGLERVGGVMTYRVTDPTDPKFVSYTTGRDFDAATAEGSVDLGPEACSSSPMGNSPTGRPLVVVSHEVTGTTTIYQVDPVRPRRDRG